MDNTNDLISRIHDLELRLQTYQSFFGETLGWIVAAFTTIVVVFLGLQLLGAIKLGKAEVLRLKKEMVQYLGLEFDKALNKIKVDIKDDIINLRLELDNQTRKFNFETTRLLAFKSEDIELFDKAFFNFLKAAFELYKVKDFNSSLLATMIKSAQDNLDKVQTIDSLREDLSDVDIFIKTLSVNYRLEMETLENMLRQKLSPKVVVAK